MNFPRYPKYRDSGIPWLGEVPEGWVSRKLKYFALFSGGGTPSRDNLAYWNGDIPWVSPKDMKSEAIYRTEDTITVGGLRNSSTSLVSPGHVLLVVRSGILKHTIPVAINEVEVALNQDMKALLLNPTVCSNQFFLRWVQGFNDDLLQAWLKQGATVESIEHEYLANSIVPMPSISEQQAIAAFLDRETARIDALVEKKTRFIDLLREKRQALITEAVTGKFDVTTGKPYPAYRNSGVPWLGNVPEGWGVKRLKFAAPLQSGKLAAKGLDLPYIGLENIESWTGKFIPNAEADETEGVSNTFSAGDVLFGKLRPYLAKALLPDFDGLCSSELLVLHGKEMLPAYLLRFVLSYDFVNQVDASTYGTKMPRANWEFIGNLPAIVPPVDEQAAIAAFLDRETVRIDVLTEKTKKSIDFLKERRAALITAAVTGKIDVRTA